MIYICAYCDAPIPDEDIARRHYSQARRSKPLYCNREHAVLGMQQRGHYKRMSLAGKPARSKAVAESNRLHPRRKQGSA